MRIIKLHDYYTNREVFINIDSISLLEWGKPHLGYCGGTDDELHEKTEYISSNIRYIQYIPKDGFNITISGKVNVFCNKPSDMSFLKRMIEMNGFVM